MTFMSEVKISGTGSTSGVGLGSGNELGDYLGLDFYNNVFYPVWGDNSNSDGNNPNGTSNLDFYGARVDVDGRAGTDELYPRRFGCFWRRDLASAPS